MTSTPFAVILLVDGLLAGTFLCSAMMEHAMRTLDAPHWIAFAHAKEKVFGPVMPVFFGVALLATIAGAALLPPHARLLAAAVALAGAGAITGAINLPLNARFLTWSAADHPADWAADRQRWQRWTLVRTALAVAAFAVLV